MFTSKLTYSRCVLEFYILLLLFFLFLSPLQAEIKLGFMGPLTGSNAVYGDQMRHGILLAVEEINAAGGILGQKIELLIGDDGGDPKQGVAVANKFLSENVVWAIGPGNSGVAAPVSEIYNDHNMLHIIPVSTLPQLTEKGFKYLFRICGRDDQQVPVAAQYILKHFRDKKVALLHDKSAYGKGMADELKKLLQAASVQEVLFEGVNSGEKDYSPVVSKLKAVQAEVVYWGGLATEGALIVRQMREHGLTTRMISGDGIANDEFLAIGGAGVEGTLFTYAPDPRQRPEALRIKEKFLLKNVSFESFTLYTYASLELLQQAAEQAKSLQSKDIAALLHSGKPFKTILGEMRFDSERGDPLLAEYVIYVWEKGEAGKLVYRELKE